MVGDGIARASGLVNCMAGELLEFEDGNFGMAQNLEENSVSIVIFGSDENIGEGQTVKRTGCVGSGYSSGCSVCGCDAASALKRQSEQYAETDFASYHAAYAY